jgi:hypothetical protein
MFQVDMSTVQLPIAPDERAGVLIFNGHLKDYVEPVVEGWLAEQRRDHHRSFEILHLDAIVKWIVDSRLLSDLREALVSCARDSCKKSSE